MPLYKAKLKKGQSPFPHLPSSRLPLLPLVLVKVEILSELGLLKPRSGCSLVNADTSKTAAGGKAAELKKQKSSCPFNGHLLLQD